VFDVEVKATLYSVMMEGNIHTIPSLAEYTVTNDKAVLFRRLGGDLTALPDGVPGLQAGGPGARGQWAPARYGEPKKSAWDHVPLFLFPWGEFYTPVSMHAVCRAILSATDFEWVQASHMIDHWDGKTIQVSPSLGCYGVESMLLVTLPCDLLPTAYRAPEAGYDKEGSDNARVLHQVIRDGLLLAAFQ
jgi:hypothetical protein